MIELWFVVIAFLWTGYFVLEGFDFGVGLLAPFVSGDEDEHKQALQTIGPVWDGNEVWLISAVGATFAAFPAWYAGLLSSFYIPLVLVLTGLIVRGVGLEWRGKVANTRWADLGIVVGSALPAFVWGAVFAQVLGYGPVLGGLFSLAASALHGAIFLALKTDGAVRRRARVAALVTGLVAVPLAALALPALGPVAIAALVALMGALVLIWQRREGWAFTATAGAIVLVSVAVFAGLRTAPLPGLTLEEAASGPYTLGVLTWIGLAILPFILLYQGWTYWVFRKRVSLAH
ncbi:cytochrome d ubiquinol oxidase subunit II [Nonomuraea soli]|uniref:Cytochrome d ubiquinol oxidase subunit II n=1 Tax=Nonomuraea soli TaxID=1032476 RepID=A0A7W0CNX3_9ACTN|nr:cytochrome d ubiquinol oxidase subunit II [Nonomuraea soli]MBA2894612.1 cytochrome d ubiquinol oxidase subunit II [Nonomuraea soli]